MQFKALLNVPLDLDLLVLNLDLDLVPSVSALIVAASAILWIRAIRNTVILLATNQENLRGVLMLQLPISVAFPLVMIIGVQVLLSPKSNITVCLLCSLSMLQWQLLSPVQIASKPILPPSTTTLFLNLL